MTQVQKMPEFVKNMPHVKAGLKYLPVANKFKPAGCEQIHVFVKPNLGSERTFGRAFRQGDEGVIQLKSGRLPLDMLRTFWHELAHIRKNWAQLNPDANMKSIFERAYLPDEALPEGHKRGSAEDEAHADKAAETTMNDLQPTIKSLQELGLSEDEIVDRALEKAYTVGRLS